MEFVRTNSDQNLRAQDEYADPSSLPPNDIASFFMETSFDAMLLVDGDGCIECTNSAAIRLLGQPGAAMVGRPISDVVSLKLYPIPRSTSVNEAVAEFEGMLFTMRRTDLSVATVVLRKTNGPSGRQLWVLRDVTLQRPIAEALERKTRLLMEAERVGKMGAWELDTGTGLLLFTEELQHMLGLIDSPVVPLEYAYSLYTDASRAIVREAFSATMIHGTPYDLELEMRTQRGDLIWVREVCRATYCDGRMVSLTGITQDITERRRMADLLARSADLERARIGADLHDGLGQELTGLALYLQGAALRAEHDNPGMSHDLAELAKIASKSVETVRDMTHSMLPLELRQMGFVRVCQQLAVTTQKSSGVVVRFRYLGHPSRVPKGPSAEHMYRIVQESIANAVKHANATRISVTLKASETKLVLTVSDNGNGIDATRTTGGIGLQIMRYRARLLGGLLDVRRSSSGGTIVRSVLPRSGDPIK
jgi:signal transduction histidine kinase